MSDIQDQVILVVEDNDVDFDVLKRAFRDIGLNNPIVRCETGDDALDFVHKGGKFENNTQKPLLMVLDLNMPATDGRTVLRTIKNHPDHEHLITVVLTSSTSERDIEECYDMGANGYIEKSLDYDKFVKSVSEVKNFWIDTILSAEEHPDA